MVAVAVLVPGIMGSVLKLGNEVIWPGPLHSLWLPFGRMKEFMRDDLQATDCVRSYSITRQYQTLIDDLNTCGFSEASRTLLIAAYDWRKDNAKSAQGLAEHLDSAVTDHGADVDISIIAHSMGGLISRYYLESGEFEGRPGFSSVRRLVTIGTPHNGAATALPAILGFEKRLFLSKDQALQAASDPRFPAAYQLLPPEGEPFVWHDDAGGNLADIYQPDLAKDLGLIEANLDAARQFRARLNLARRPENVRYYCFTGTSQTTATHVLLRPARGGRPHPYPVEEEHGGDGTVPTWSGMVPRLERQFVVGEHSTLYKGTVLRSVLGTLLGKPHVLAGVPENVDVALRDRVVEPEDEAHVAISFEGDVTKFSGVLTIERAEIDPSSGFAIGFDPPTQVHPLTHEGLKLERISLIFRAPDLPGSYRIAFRDDSSAAPSGFDELIVQQP